MLWNFRGEREEGVIRKNGLIMEWRKMSKMPGNGLRFQGENPKSHLIMNTDHNFSRYPKVRVCLPHLLPSGSTCPYSRLLPSPFLPSTYLHHIPLNLPNPPSPNLPTSLLHPLTHFRSPFTPHDPEYGYGQNPHQGTTGTMFFFRQPWPRKVAGGR